MIRHTRLTLLLAGTAMIAPGALAQQSPTAGATSNTTHVHHARAHHAARHGAAAHKNKTTQAAPAAAAPATSTAYAPAAPRVVTQASSAGSESILVTGRSARTRLPGGGLMRVETAPKAVMTISRDFIAKQSPTTNAQQLLRMLPSTNVTDADPYGLFSGTSRVRGLDTSEQGYVLEGLPLNDIGNSAFYSNEVVEAEDLESVQLQPGTVNLDTPTVSAAGGLVTLTMKDPAMKPGGLVDISYGTYKLNREFIRLDSGVIGNSGLRGMFAFSHTHANNYMGPGGAEKKHIDVKIVNDFANGSRASFVVAYNDQVNDSYNYGSFTAANFANLISKGNSNSYLADYKGVNTAGTNYYKLHVNPFNNVIVSAPSTAVINSHLHIDDTPYFWHGIGNGTGASILTEGSTWYGNINEPIDLNGDGKVTKATAIALTPSNQEQFRPGNVLKLVFTPDKHHTIEAGYWYEYSNLLQYSPVVKVNQATGEAANIWGQSSFYTLPNGQPYWYRNWLTITNVNMLFLGDTAKYFDNRLTVAAGFKEAMIHRNLDNYIPGTTYNRTLNIAEPLPQLGVSWQFNKANQVYVSVATNFRAPSNASLADQISNTNGKPAQVGGDSRSEYSISEEVGYRYNGPVVVGSISFFNYNFTNRQISLNFFSGGAPYSQTVNAGGQTTRGVDIQLSTLPILYHLRPYATFEYLDARVDNNLAARGTLANGQMINDYLPTTGKVAIASPKVQAKLGIDYDDGSFFLGTDLDYVGQQYSTFMNDEKMPDFITNSVYGGYRFHSWGRLKAPQIQINAANLTGQVYRTGIYSYQNNAKATRGVFGSTIGGSAPAYYIQPGFYIAATLSSSF